MVVRLPPLDVQRPARKVHSRRAVAATLQHASNHCRARARPARQCRAGAALPHHHAQVAARKHLHELGVCARREHRVLFKQWADRGEVELVHLHAASQPRKGDGRNDEHADWEEGGEDWVTWLHGVQRGNPRP
eukprot:363563-Chlamydomonas_euryale.AAC.6